MTRRLIAFALALGLAAHARGVDAAVIHGAVSVNSSLGTFGPSFPLSNLINQSGLSTGYVSGVTNAAGFNPVHTNSFAEWNSNQGVVGGNPQPLNLPGVVTFDMGQAIVLSGFLYWGSDWLSQGGNNDVRTFELHSDSDGNPNNGFSALLGSYTTASTNAPHPMQSFAFSATSTRFVQMRITSTHGATSIVGFAEAAFIGEPIPPPPPVPEPSSLMCLGLALVFGAVQRGILSRRS